MKGNPHPKTAHLHTYQFKPGNPGGPGGARLHVSDTKPYTEAHRVVAHLRISQLKVRKSDTVAIGVAKSLARKAVEEASVAHANEIASRIEGPLRNVQVEVNTMTLAQACQATENKGNPPSWIAAAEADDEAAFERVKKALEEDDSE